MGLAYRVQFRILSLGFRLSTDLWVCLSTSGVIRTKLLVVEVTERYLKIAAEGVMLRVKLGVYRLKVQKNPKP